MNHRLAAVAAVITAALPAAGCVEPGTSSHQIVDELELADLGPTTLSITMDGQSLWLTFRSAGCASLAGTVNARLDGVDGITYRYAWETTDQELGHSTSSCQHPRIGWPLAEVPEGPLTIEVFDGTSEWWFVVDSPRTTRWLDGAAAGATLRSGEPVRLQITPATGPLLGAYVVSETAERKQTIYPTVDASQIAFTVPEVTAELVATFDVFVQFELAVTECSGPAACQARASLQERWSVVLTP